MIRQVNLDMDEYRGLSSDTKPSGIANGSIFLEIDTGAKYMYDAENEEWCLMPSSGGGGGGGGDNTEVISARTGADGTRYGSLKGRLDAENEDLNDKIDGEISLLKSQIQYKTIDLKQEMFVKYINTNVGIGNVVDLTLSGTTSWHRIVPCYKSDIFYIKGTGTNTDARAWAFTDSEFRLLSISASGAVNEEVKAPSDGYAIFNLSANSYIGDSSLLLKRVLSLTNEARLNILSELTSIDVTAKFTEGKYIKTDISPGNAVNINSPVTSTARAYFITKIYAGEKVTLTGTGGGSPRLWAFLDVNAIMLRVASTSTSAESLELTALQDGYFLANVAVANDYSLILHQYTALTKTAPGESVSPYIDPFDYGVVGDGSTDDTNAINAAFAAAEGKTIQFPSGTYKFSGTLVIPSNTHVIGAGQSTVFQLADTFTLSSIRHREDQDSYKYPMMRLADGAVSCTLEHFKIKGQTEAFVDEPEVGLLVVGKDHIVNDVTVEDINFFPDDFAGRTSNAPAWGFMIFHADHIRVTNCKGVNCGYEALGTEVTTDCLIDNFEAGFCNQTCLQVHRNSYDITFDSCSVRYELPEGATVRPAFTMHGGSDDYDLDGITISKCNFYGGITFIGGYENGISILNNVASGGVTMNAAVNRKNIFIIGNRLGGGISGRYDHAVIVGNMATNNTGGRYITVTGTDIICAHNIPLGTGRYVAVNDVTVEQWGTNPALT